MPEPFIKFYPNDWTSDERLNRCRLASREVWKRMLILMRTAEPFGYFVGHHGEPIDLNWFSAEVHATAKEVRSCIRELEEQGVFSRDASGRIYSRKMVRDKARQEQLRANGLRGGNPVLLVNQDEPLLDKKFGYPTLDNPIVIQKLEARDSDSLRSSALEFGDWPTDNGRLRELALVFLAAFGNCFDPVKAQKHLGAYMQVLAEMRSRDVSISEAWQACAEALDANGKPLFSSTIRMAKSFLPARSLRRKTAVSADVEGL